MNNTLGVLDLSENEESIYKILLVSGQLSSAEVADAAKLDPETTKSVLQDLESKKLARSIPGMIGRYAALLPLGSTKDELRAASDKLAVVGREIDQTADSELQQLRQQLETATQEFSTNVNQEIQSFESSVDELKSTVEQNQQEGLEAITNTGLQQNQRITETISSSKSSHNQRAVQFRSSGSSRITSKREAITTQADEAKAQQTSIKQQATDQLGELDLSPLEPISGDATIGITDTMTEVGSKVNQINEQVMAALNKSQELFTQSTSSLQSIGQQFQSGITNTVNGSASQLDEALRQRIQQLEKIQQDLAEQFTKQKSLLETVRSHSGQFVNQSQTTLTETGTQLDQSGEQLKSTLTGQIASVGEHATNLIAEADTSISGHLDQTESDLNQLLSTSINEIHSQFQQQITQFLESSQIKLNEMVTEFGTKLSGKKASLNQQISDLRTQKEAMVQSQLETTGGMLTGAIDQFKTLQQEQLSSLSNSLQENQQAHTEALSATESEFDRSNQSLNTLLKSSQGRFGEWNLQLQDEIDKQLQAITSQVEAELTTKLTELQTHLDESMNTITSEAQASVNSVENQVATLTAKTTSGIQDAIDTLRSSLTTLHQNMVNRLQTALEQSTQSYNSFIDHQTRLSDELLTQLDQDVSTVEQDMVNSMNEQLDTLLSNLTGAIEGVQSSFTTMISELFASITSHVDQAKSMGSIVLTKVNTLSSKGTASQLSAVERTFNTYGQKYKSNTDQITDKVNALATLLDNFFKMQEETETPTIKTTHVVGKQAIVKYMTEMISRVKSKMTILAPHISQVNVEKIMELPMTAQITIVSEIDEVADKDWIDKMHGAKANVTLRTLTQQGFGAQLPNFIGCEREGEEIIIGTLDEGNQDYVAIASNSENFVKIFGSQIISEYSRGRSRQLQK